MLLDKYINVFGDIVVSDTLPTIYVAFSVLIFMFSCIVVGIIDLILFPVEIIIWFKRRKNNE